MKKILPTISCKEQLDIFLETDYESCAFADINLIQLFEWVPIVKKQGRKVFVHTDMIYGLGKHIEAVEFLNSECNIDGIVSTVNNLVVKAKQLGLISVRRIFLIDTLSLERNIQSINKYCPDYIEVLPAIAPGIGKYIRDSISPDIKMMAGGLIRTQEDIDKCIESGFTLVSVGNEKLWERS